MFMSIVYYWVVGSKVPANTKLNMRTYKRTKRVRRFINWHVTYINTNINTYIYKTNTRELNVPVIFTGKGLSSADDTATDSSPLLSLSSHQFHSKLETFLLNNPFLLSLVCTNSCRFSGSLTLLTVFISQSFSPCRSFHIVHQRQCLWISISYSCLASNKS